MNELPEGQCELRALLDTDPEKRSAALVHLVGRCGRKSLVGATLDSGRVLS